MLKQACCVTLDAQVKLRNVILQIGILALIATGSVAETNSPTAMLFVSLVATIAVVACRNALVLLPPNPRPA